MKLSAPHQLVVSSIILLPCFWTSVSSLSVQMLRRKRVMDPLGYSQRTLEPVEEEPQRKRMLDPISSSLIKRSEDYGYLNRKRMLDPIGSSLIKKRMLDPIASSLIKKRRLDAIGMGLLRRRSDVTDAADVADDVASVRALRDAYAEDITELAQSLGRRQLDEALEGLIGRSLAGRALQRPAPDPREQDLRVRQLMQPELYPGRRHLPDY